MSKLTDDGSSGIVTGRAFMNWLIRFNERTAAEQMDLRNQFKNALASCPDPRDEPAAAPMTALLATGWPGSELRFRMLMTAAIAHPGSEAWVPAMLTDLPWGGSVPETYHALLAAQGTVMRSAPRYKQYLHERQLELKRERTTAALRDMRQGQLELTDASETEASRLRSLEARVRSLETTLSELMPIVTHLVPGMPTHSVLLPQPSVKAERPQFTPVICDGSGS